MLPFAAFHRRSAPAAVAVTCSPPGASGIAVRPPATAMVAPACEERPAMLTATNTRLPEGVAAGSRRFTWNTPETRPGASPTKITSAGTPPTVALTEDVASCGLVPVITPSPYGGCVRPAPDTNNETSEPGAAGFPDELTDMSWFSAAV